VPLKVYGIKLEAYTITADISQANRTADPKCHRFRYKSFHLALHKDVLITGTKSGNPDSDFIKLKE